MPISRRRLLISIPILWMGLSLGCLGKKKQKELTFEEAKKYWIKKYKHHQNIIGQSHKYFTDRNQAHTYFKKTLNAIPGQDFKIKFIKSRNKELLKEQLIEINGYLFAPVEIALLRIMDTK